MKPLDASLSRLMARVLFVLVLAATVSALAVIGLVWLVQALTLELAPLTGQAAAHALAGVAALLPVAILFILLRRSARRVQHAALGDSLRQSVRNNPWESLGMAFFMGFTSNGRRPHRAHVLTELLRRPESSGDSSESSEQSQPERRDST